MNQEQLTRGELETLLKAAADLIRTRVDYTFILVLLFYKRISDKWELEFEEAYKEALEDGFSEEEARAEAQNSIYVFPEEELEEIDVAEEWKEIRRIEEELLGVERKIEGYLDELQFKIQG